MCVILAKWDKMSVPQRAGFFSQGRCRIDPMGLHIIFDEVLRSEIESLRMWKKQLCGNWVIITVACMLVLLLCNGSQKWHNKIYKTDSHVVAGSERMTTRTSITAEEEMNDSFGASGSKRKWRRSKQPTSASQKGFNCILQFQIFIGVYLRCLHHIETTLANFLGVII